MKKVKGAKAAGKTGEIKVVGGCRLLPAVTAGINDGVVDVAKKLHDFQERRAYILNGKKFPIGIISIVDINDRVVAKGIDPKKVKAGDIMSYPLNIILDVNTPVEEAKKKMAAHDNYYCPVIEKGVFKGLLIYSNLIEALGR